MRYLVLTIFLLGVFRLSAQQVDWLESWPVDWDLNPGMPEEIIASAPGYLVSMRTVDVTHNYSQEIYGEVAIEGLDPETGASLWICLLGDSVSMDAAVADENGIAYFAGRFQGDQLEICDGTILTYVGDAIDENAFLIAWDLDEDMLIWAKNLTAEVGGWHTVAAMAVCADGSLWYAMEDFFEAVLVHSAPGGNVLETRVITDCKAIGSVSCDPFGGLYVSGAADNTGFSFAGVTPVIDGQYNMFVLRYRPDGGAGFAVFAEDITFQTPRVVATGDGHAYLAGNVFDGTNWGGFEVNGPDWVSAIFLAKLDSSGIFHWLVESDPAGGPITGDVEAARNICIALDEYDNVYFTGTLRGLVDWGNGVVSDGLTTGSRTLTVVAFDQAGIPLWSRTSQPGGNVWAQAITAGAEDGAIHFAGHITSEFTMGAHTTNTGGAQAAVVGRISGLGTDIDQAESIRDLLMWPIPATDVLFLELDLPSAISADLYNSAGQRVQSLVLRPGLNAIPVAALAKGLYLLRPAGRSAVRLVKE